MNPSSTPSSSGSNSNNWFFGCLGLIALALATCGAWFFTHLPEQKEYAPPDRLKLTTRPVPLSRQVLVLVDDHPGSAYFDSIRAELLVLTNHLTEDQQICLFQVVTDHPVFRHEPWCSQQIKSTWWVMPEIKPPPYADQAEERAYAAARAKLEAELDANFMRAQSDWAAEHADRLLNVENALWQLPEQPYHSLVDSLVRLVEVRKPTSDQPAEVWVYSPMVDAKFAPAQSTLQVDLEGVDVQIRLMTSEKEEGLRRARTEWAALLDSGKPRKVTWTILEPQSDEVTRQSKATHPAPVPKWGSLPPVVPKAPVADRTNVIQGEPIPGDATSVVRE